MRYGYIYQEESIVILLEKDTIREKYYLERYYVIQICLKRRVETYQFGLLA